LAAKFSDFFVKANAAEPGRDARSERCAVPAFGADGVPKDLPNFFFGAAAVAPRAALQLLLHVIIKLANEELSHAAMISRYLHRTSTSLKRSTSRRHYQPNAE